MQKRSIHDPWSFPFKTVSEEDIFSFFAKVAISSGLEDLHRFGAGRALRPTSLAGDGQHDLKCYTSCYI